MFYGTTSLVLAQGRLGTHLSQGIYVETNARAIMGAGLAGEVRLLAGAEMERELREHLPLVIGSAYLTSPGKLAGRGVLAIAHGVTAPRPGEPARPAESQRAFLEGIRALVDQANARSVTIPAVGWSGGANETEQAARGLAELISGLLRRRTAPKRLTITSLHETYLAALQRALAERGAVVDS
jgi:O-acetyl-ADP-ribose deacetylase (regulator of RNase III)